MRFELAAAYCIGVFLPAVEVWRRRTDFSNIPSYVDDFIMGGLLIYAARAVSKKQRNGSVLLVSAWGIYCGGMYYSFFGQVNNASANDISGLSNGIVIAVKAVLFLVGIVSLVKSVRGAAVQENAKS